MNEHNEMEMNDQENDSEGGNETATSVRDDIEIIQFYEFLYQNDLRKEALQILNSKKR